MHSSGQGICIEIHFVNQAWGEAFVGHGVDVNSSSSASKMLCCKSSLVFFTLKIHLIEVYEQLRELIFKVKTVPTSGLFKKQPEQPGLVEGGNEMIFKILPDPNCCRISDFLFIYCL